MTSSWGLPWLPLQWCCALPALAVGRARLGAAWGLLATGQANSQQEGGSAGRGLGAPKALPKPQGTQPRSWDGDTPAVSRAPGRGGPSAWRGMGGRVCVCTPCQASSAGPCTAEALPHNRDHAERCCWSEAGCGRVLHSLSRAGQGSAQVGLAEQSSPCVGAACGS